MIRFFTIFHLLSYTAGPKLPRALPVFDPCRRFMLAPPGRGRLSEFFADRLLNVPSYTKTFRKEQNPTRAKKYFFVFEKTLKSQGLFFY
ncbi:MAG: hypothetical protein LBK23_08275 [Oscillospiraceae bacterium]|jgi:hypothetical protein|nr:hypothetical protein [Oscillospiraceae bacterium]